MYLALYRKFRPNNFDLVIGQNHITTTLRNQVQNKQVSHAYLFTGTRGTGKTSVAKIFAQAINCQNPVNGNPCGKCETCLALSEPNNMDVLEIDAASNNRVDEIRELREKVKYPPVNGKFKVYIIDEVHMLTDSAFNALLKTLEEPPKHVVFILATTEVQKLPATILSRCMRFDFKLVSSADLEKHLQYIFDKENVKYEKEALSLIASLGEGSVRDMLSVADMVVAYSNKNVTYESVLESVGAIDKRVLFSLGESILQKNANTVLSQIDDILKLGKSVSQIAKDLSTYYRDLAIVKTTNTYAEILKYPSNLIDMLEASRDKFVIEDVLNALKTFSSLDNQFRNTVNPRLALEVATLNLVNGYSFKDLEQRVEKLEKNIENNIEKKSSKTLNVSSRINANLTVNVDDVGNESFTQQIKEIVLEEFSNDYEFVNSEISDNYKPVLETGTAQSETQNIEMITIIDQNHDFSFANNTAEEFEGNVNLSYSNSNELFAKVLIKLRETNEVVLHSLLGSGIVTSLNCNEFSIIVGDEIKHKTILKPENMEKIKNALFNINGLITLKVELNENYVKTNSASVIETRLLQLFGKHIVFE